jgi:formylglycine-generating enzyme required for sulfatase activity/serine/threonine protein kinase
MNTAAALAPGTLIDELRIDRVLGQGASGVTYLVTDTVLDKTFTLKEYLPGRGVVRRDDGALKAADPKYRDGFQRGLRAFVDEGRTIARFDHPNVLRVFRCFEANGTAYLQMPWYQGETLDVLLQRGGTLDREETLALALPLLDALEYIHGHGVVHRDIKPANIYVTQDGQPVLLDFGNAARAEDTAAGSEGYAAPEQYTPGAQSGPWTDIYGLAATLYRATSGHIPPPAIERRNALASGDADPLVPPARRLPPRGFGRLPAAIEAGLALDPARRPSSASEWRRQFGIESGVAGSRAAAEREGREWLPMILLGVFVIVLAAAVIYLFLPHDGPPGSPDGAVQEPLPPGLSPEEESRWKAALNADTAYGYQQFMADFPESIHSDQAELQLQRLDHQAWGRARADGNRAAIENYLEQFPAGLHRADAEILLNELRLVEEAEQRRLEAAAREEEADWEATRATRTVAAVDTYLAAWPGGAHADEARELRSALQRAEDDRRAFEAAEKLGTREGWQAYIDAFPQGSGVAAALEAIDDLTLRPGKVFSDCVGCPRMVVVSAGSFWQGSDATNPLALKKETPRRMVTIAEPFAIGVHEVTFEQWDRCVANGGCSTRPADNGWGRGDRPVIMVSWNDAQEYAAWLSQATGQRYSLPSESQWEYAARAGQEGDWPGGDPALVCRFANVAGGETSFRWQHDDCSDAAALSTLPVGTLQANAFGLYDTIGNVAEWTLDCMNLSYLDAPSDGGAWSRGICSSRMTRGGSWFTGTQDIRLPARFNLKNGDRNDFTGLRVVRVIQD